MSELENLINSMKKLKICENNDDDEDTDNSFSSFSQSNGSYDEINELFISNISETQNLPVGSYNSVSSTTNLEDIEIESKLSKNKELSSQTCSKILSMQKSETCSDIDVNKILNYLDKLSRTPKKTVLNDHLRIQFELLSQMPAAFNVFVQSKTFFCTLCNLIFSDQHNWAKHVGEFHNKIIDLSVFYCSICRVYHISDKYSSNNINKHLNCLEHCVMSEFQDHLKKNVTYPITNNRVNSIPTNNSDVLNHKEDDRSDGQSEQNYLNESIYIEIKSELFVEIVLFY